MYFNRNSEFYKKIEESVEEFEGKPYKQDWTQLVKAAYHANDNDDLSSLFCSQLIAAILQRISFIPADCRTNNFVPADFASDTLSNYSELRPLPKLPKILPIELKRQISDTMSANGISFHALIEDKINQISITDIASKRDQQMKFYIVFIITVTSVSGWNWILFKRYNDFVDLDKNVIYSFFYFLFSPLLSLFPPLPPFFLLFTYLSSLCFSLPLSCSFVLVRFSSLPPHFITFPLLPLFFLPHPLTALLYFLHVFTVNMSMNMNNINMNILFI